MPVGGLWPGFRSLVILLLMVLLDVLLFGACILVEASWCGAGLGFGVNGFGSYFEEI